MAKQQANRGDDAIKVEASSTSVAVSIEGRAASRAADALIDVISPFTNAAGWVGDQLSYVRIRAAIRAASKAGEQLKREGITNAKIPPKILLPWLEGASLETEETESLSDAWAGLFVRAAKSSDAVTISYIDTLKKLGKEEAELLQIFATDTSPDFSQIFYDREDFHIFSETNRLRHVAISELETLLSKKNIGPLAKYMNEWGYQGMCQIILFSCEGHRLVPTEYFKKHEHVIANLEHLGLISTKQKIIETKKGPVEIFWFEITKYTFDLIWACHGTLTGAAAKRERKYVPINEVVRKMKESE
jgi:hypothetical protein